MSRKLVLSAVMLAIPVCSASAQDGAEGSAGASGTANKCVVDFDRMMDLAPDAFDQDMLGGWRVIASQKGCEKAAADLIKSYISHNWARIGQRNLHVMYWHAGQMEAFAGNYRQAVPLLMAGVGPEKRRVEMGFYEYAQGTIAFLNGDLIGLKAARQRLAVVPEPSWYGEELKAGRMTNWPINLSVMDNLIRCFGFPYSIAYGNSCPGG